MRPLIVDGEMTKRVMSGQTSIVFTGLDSFTKYFISVSACIRDLCSGPSDQITKKTHEARKSYSRITKNNVIVYRLRHGPVDMI